ncbi:MAG: hypothetical protein V9G12_14270 [Microthrixaceae bacterium]
MAQVWRGGDDRQAHLARLLRAVEVVPLDDALGRAAGILLGVAGTSDAIDAAVVLLSRDRDEVLTSDPHDLTILAEAAGLQIDLVPV